MVTEPSRLQWHEDPVAFDSLLTLTAAKQGFLVRLVEKDYFCSVLLEYLAAACPSLVFKGGTCIAKVHSEFHRISEDLDFTVPVDPGTTRSERGRLSEPLKGAMRGLAARLPDFRIVSPLRGSNNSTQYNAVVGYASRVGQNEETIKIEAGLREALLMPAIEGNARTLLLGPEADRPLVPTVRLRCLSLMEAMAEKLRAALSRRAPVIRDFYDVDHAIRRRGFQVDPPAFRILVRRKLGVPGTGPIDLSAARFGALESQLEPELRPVLRTADFEAFDLRRAFDTVASVAEAVSQAS